MTVLSDGVGTSGPDGAERAPMCAGRATGPGGARRRLRVAPHATVVVRPPSFVQIGVSGDGAPLLAVPPWLAPDAAAALVRWLQTYRGYDELLRRAADSGLSPDETAELVTALDAAGAIEWWQDPTPLHVHVHGRGPVADALLAELDERPQVRVTVVTSPAWDPVDRVVDLVLLTDAIVVDPVLAQRLMRARVAHLPVRLRDGAGLVGPLVLPGVSPCLRCLDRARADIDPAWPTVACQLTGRPGRASRPTVRLTAAVAAGQVDRIVAARPAPTGAPAATAAPESLGCTLEIDTGRCGVATRRWAMHPGCGCGRAPAHRRG
ncbi:hypothetical protein [Tsukamurella soli]|uniref:hypothetical protein n=1 Tax=Tsukamurella soli TaxID=644556 RepID=UPI003607A59E